jgi:hypothetical protein
MSELDDHVARFSLLKQESVDEERFFNFYAKCDQLPIAYLERALDMHKTEAKSLSDKTIPELMFSENRRSVETMDGVTITIKGEVNASLKGSELSVVYNWLNHRGYGSIVKQRHYLAEEEVPEGFIEHLKEEGVSLHADLSLNTNSFKAAVKKIYAETDELPPPEVAECSIFNHAVIKTEKKDNDE